MVMMSIAGSFWVSTITCGHCDECLLVTGIRFAALYLLQLAFTLISIHFTISTVPPPPIKQEMEGLNLEICLQIGLDAFI
jgi:hypothetical protein